MSGTEDDLVVLLGLDIKMFYGGPKEAVMHAIYRQNFGFTDVVTHWWAKKRPVRP